jgi:hypothetical protein
VTKEIRVPTGEKTPVIYKTKKVKLFACYKEYRGKSVDYNICNCAKCNPFLEDLEKKLISVTVCFYCGNDCESEHVHEQCQCITCIIGRLDINEKTLLSKSRIV